MRRRTTASIRLATLALVTAAASASVAADDERPNIVVIAVRSLNDFVRPLNGFADVLPDADLQARVSPNLDRLAELGATFTNAQSLSTTGKTTLTAEPTDLASKLDRATPSLMEWLEGNGYATETARAVGKIAPHRLIEPPWSLSGDQADDPPWAQYVPANRRGQDDRSIAAWERLTDSMPDQRAAAWTATQVLDGAEDDRPRFVALEISQPTPPWITPQVFGDRFPIDQIKPPRTLDGDRDDLPPSAQRLGDGELHRRLLAATPGDDLAWRQAIRAYLASIAAADYAVGKVLDAVDVVNADADPANDWAVLLWSDHGAHVGQKAVWGGGTLWEEATRVNLMLYAPGRTEAGRRIETPVSLRSIAPTIAELARIEPQASSQGESLLALVAAPLSRPAAVAVTSHNSGEAFGIRSKRFRLIRYGDGSEELYDLEKDPEGFYNLLRASNAAKLQPFGLSPSQVESVRRWHVAKLVAHLVEIGSTDLAIQLNGGRQPDGPLEPAAGLPGDYTGDGVVNAADKTLWRDTLGDEVPVGTGADGDHDGRIDEGDETVWRANYGRRLE